MPGSTTPDNITFPVVGDKIAPLETWFANQAASTQTAISGIRSEFGAPEYPAPQTATGAEQQVVSATAWADLPNISPITFDLPQACWVMVSLGCWLQSQGGTGWTRGSFRISGATTLGETQVEVGGVDGVWGQVAQAVDGRIQCSITKIVRLNAGSNTITFRSYHGSGGTTKRCDYAALQAVPVRWA